MAPPSADGRGRRLVRSPLPRGRGRRARGAAAVGVRARGGIVSRPRRGRRAKRTSVKPRAFFVVSSFVPRLGGFGGRGGARRTRVPSRLGRPRRRRRDGMGRVVRHVHLPRVGRVDGGWKRFRRRRRTRKRSGARQPPLDAGGVRDGVVLHPTGVDGVRAGAGVRAAVPDAEPEGARRGVVRVRHVRRELCRGSVLQVCRSRRLGV
mmetsp:Transcript_11131/g.50398  ORF Transcript_11131/g.50398 Transcript_11131/m.50398 type:complete len:206 (+) Transcript_11131:454-1071(+)